MSEPDEVVSGEIVKRPAEVAATPPAADMRYTDDSAKERWRDWASRAEWRFTSYYKYSFTFTAEGSLLPSGVREEFTAAVTVGGDADGIYRYAVSNGPMTWDEVLTAGGSVHLHVAKADGTLLRDAFAEDGL